MLRYVNNGTVIWLFYFLPQLFFPRVGGSRNGDAMGFNEVFC